MSRRHCICGRATEVHLGRIPFQEDSPGNRDGHGPRLRKHVQKYDCNAFYIEEVRPNADLSEQSPVQDECVVSAPINSPRALGNRPPQSVRNDEEKKRTQTMSQTNEESIDITNKPSTRNQSEERGGGCKPGGSESHKERSRTFIHLVVSRSEGGQALTRDQRKLGGRDAETPRRAAAEQQGTARRGGVRRDISANKASSLAKR
ncbi:hypothetical protein E2P81_ATG10898 [Venturia nashicola]|uniref:Uncharacterized protein n=1 Tax=Venturia nashicola TaxID=86259 RepID=A0A4Z1PAK1_9PEZI|nr:hypothetical protein E6O75_ATG10572 [Venturia nashicola]TLD27610.1 hypothetical protein E2P81_ATG10898 [Venturia nashicola]